MTTSREIHLKSRPVGTPTAANFEMVTVTLPAPGPGEVVIDLEYSPINPSDLVLMRGLYGIKPALPAPVGSEGVARVVKSAAASPASRRAIAFCFREVHRPGPHAAKSKRKVCSRCPQKPIRSSSRCSPSIRRPLI